MRYRVSSLHQAVSDILNEELQKQSQSYEILEPREPSVSDSVSWEMLLPCEAFPKERRSMSFLDRTN